MAPGLRVTWAAAMFAETGKLLVSTIRTASVENFELDVRLDRDHLDRRRRDPNVRLLLGLVTFH
jgi:hypothetical protein